MAPRPPLPGIAAGADARHPGQDFLQIRRRLSRWFAQTQFRRAAGLLQQAGRHQKADHRNRRWPVGLVDCLRRPDVRSAGACIHGQCQLPAEALPPFHDADLGRRSVRQPDQFHQRRPRRPRRRSQLPGLTRPGHFGSRGRSGRRPAHLLHTGFGAQSRDPAPVDRRPGSKETVRENRPLSGRRVWSLRRRLQLRRHRFPFPRRPRCRRQTGGKTAPGRRRTDFLPDPDQGRLRL